MVPHLTEVNVELKDVDEVAGIIMGLEVSQYENWLDRQEQFSLEEIKNQGTDKILSQIEKVNGMFFHCFSTPILQL